MTHNKVIIDKSNTLLSSLINTSILKYAIYDVWIFCHLGLYSLYEFFGFVLFCFQGGKLSKLSPQGNSFFQDSFIVTEIVSVDYNAE